MRGKATKVILIGLIVVLVGAFFAFDLGRYLSLDYLKARQHDFQQFYAANRALTLGAYFIIYVVVTALSLPGAAVMTLAGGALFGFWPALIVVSFASTIGATLAFLVSRYLLRDWVQARFGDRLKTINAGIENEGAFYLFTLRLLVIIPFVVINLVMGLTPMRTLTFYLVSQVGMLAGTVVYVLAGTKLGQVTSLSDIFDLELILSFALLGIFPLMARKGVDFMRSRRALKNGPKPKKFE
jgi:uncharacterized membrane protein YdjX (TVP38/TMEM64 family)